MRVLIVDDERSVGQLIRQILEVHGHECVLAEDTVGAARALRDGRIDALTLDVRLPGQSGIDWLETLAAERPGLARRTVVISGSDLSAKELRRVSACGAAFLAKPFRLEDFARLFLSHLANGDRAATCTD